MSPVLSWVVEDAYTSSPLGDTAAVMTFFGVRKPVTQNVKPLKSSAH